jgi:hypothetical protein
MLMPNEQTAHLLTQAVDATRNHDSTTLAALLEPALQDPESAFLVLGSLADSTAAVLPDGVIVTDKDAPPQAITAAQLVGAAARGDHQMTVDMVVAAVRQGPAFVTGVLVVLLRLLADEYPANATGPSLFTSN